MSEGRERHRTRSALVIVQVALALALLVSAGLMMWTLTALRRDPGFRNPEQLMTIGLSIPKALTPEIGKVTRMIEEIGSKLAAIPGVERVAMANSLPPPRRWQNITPEYFATMGGRLLAGREFTWTENHEMRPVTMVAGNLAHAEVLTGSGGWFGVVAWEAIPPVGLASKNGHTSSAGVKRSRTLGGPDMVFTPLFGARGVWGGRGIRVCSRR